ncbi:MAG: nucleotidyltransferase substrate binding protein [Oligoflexia bacterium]|nr:nucleotidyltransferase substrate binding protein [Oligoflexia bacterium]
MQDIRWHQRLKNYARALPQLRAAIELSKKRPLSDLEKQGLIQAFEFTHELAWNVMKDYFEFQGASQVTGSRDATREAFRRGLITRGEDWMEMIQSRNHTSHTYNSSVADDIFQKTVNSYMACFEEFLTKMEGLRSQ